MTSTPDPNPSEHDENQTSRTERRTLDPVAAVSAAPPPPPAYGWPSYPPPPGSTSKRSGLMSGVFRGLISSVLLASILLNVYLGLWFTSVMAGPRETVYHQGDKTQRIVILPVTGMIGDSTATFVHQCLAALRQDRPRAVVLRIDSGGGGVSASDRVWHELVRFKQDTGIPVVASFGSMAASGGYYIAAPSDFIIAEPTTVTGSIGVIAEGFTLDRLLDKIGVQPELITATDAVKKDLLSPMRPWTDEDRKTIRVIVDAAYERFVDVVDRGRDGLNLEQVRRLATGEVFTSRQARDHKLIDDQGYLDAAIAKAMELAGVAIDAKPLVTTFSAPRRLTSLVGFGTRQAQTSPVASVRKVIAELTTPTIEYRWIP